MNSLENKNLNIITKAPHYNTGKYEPIDIMLNCKMGGCIFTVVKYLSRAGKKGSQDKYLEDLKKARYYLEKEINQQDRDHQDYDYTKKCSIATPEQLSIDWGLNAALGFTLKKVMDALDFESFVEKANFYREALMLLSDEIERVEKNNTPIPRTTHGMANPN